MRLREIGLEPDMLVCRTENIHHLSDKLKYKLGLFCNVKHEHVFESPDVDSIYEIPIVLNNQNFDNAIIKLLKIKIKSSHTKLNYLKEAIRRYKNPKKDITVAMCGKYNGLHDAYKSILEAFIHAGIKNQVKVNVKWVDTEKIEKDVKNIAKYFKDVDGILIPGGGYTSELGKC